MISVSRCVDGSSGTTTYVFTHTSTNQKQYRVTHYQLWNMNILLKFIKKQSKPMVTFLPNTTKDFSYSSEIRGSCQMKFSSEALQNLLYFWNIISKGIYFLNSKKHMANFEAYIWLKKSIKHKSLISEQWVGYYKDNWSRKGQYLCTMLRRASFYVFTNIQHNQCVPV